ncbi:MAG: nuclear transport factor 2 family protein [Actinomycetota bacterium]|nr:nuclear transport factor 2 family protein [Actinomycetota bacterium]
MDESTRKALAVEHCVRVNAADLDGLLELYSPDIRFEDPVGSAWKVGHEAFREHAGTAIAAQVFEEAGEPVAAQDGRRAAVPVTATMRYLPSGPMLAQYGLISPAADPERARMRFQYVMVIAVNEDGLIEEMRAFWGRSDITVLPD